MAADRSPLAWGPLGVVALAYVVLQAVVADRHGFHRDELYFLLSPGFLDEHFRTCRPAGTVDNGVGVDNEVQGAPITVCRGLRGTWAQR